MLWPDFLAVITALGYLAEIREREVLVMDNTGVIHSCALSICGQIEYYGHGFDRAVAVCDGTISLRGNLAYRPTSDAPLLNYSAVADGRVIALTGVCRSLAEAFFANNDLVAAMAVRDELISQGWLRQ